ncbi:MAG: hypothetical protein SFZ23_05835 [Planctomycetota bacterium]|nr:hypothetical protein [Planctomycetota bacterium]
MKTSTTGSSAVLVRAGLAAPCAVLAFAASTALASPSLRITTPPVVQLAGPSGPAIDPTSSQGQWFLNNNGLEEVRPNEFHDNIAGNGGGPNNSRAILGQLVSFATIPGTTLLTGYQIRASITNNTPNSSGAWERMRNRHQESVQQDQRYIGDMFDVKLTTHFADDGILGNFTPGLADIPSSIPAPGGSGDANVYAVNHDQLAWYSFAPNPAGGGSYQVPTWDFGTILVGQTVSRLLDFHTHAPIALSAADLANLNQLVASGTDLFINRTRDLKIGQYVQDDPVLLNITDTGIAYPNGGLQNPYGNVSVFHNIPAPGALVLGGVGSLLAARRRRA